MREDHRLDRYVPDFQRDNFQGTLSKDLKVLSRELLFSQTELYPLIQCIKFVQTSVLLMSHLSFKLMVFLFVIKKTRRQKLLG